MSEGRVNGSLNLSRALGDMDFKQSKELPAAEQMITAMPDVRTLQLHPGDEFLILACDGIWEMLTNQEVCIFLRIYCLQSHHLLPCSFLCRLCALHKLETDYNHMCMLYLGGCISKELCSSRTEICPLTTLREAGKCHMLCIVIVVAFDHGAAVYEAAVKEIVAM